MGLSAIPLQAQELPATPFDRELDLQNKQRQQEQINQQLEKNRQDILLQPPQPALPTPAEPVAGGGFKFLIHTITVDTGDQPERAVDITALLRSYENRELGNTELFALIRDVSNRYTQAGYSTTTVSLVPKNMKQGQVELKINWGKVDGWLINGKAPDTLQQQLLTSLAMPGVVGKPLNIHDVDQMVENLNNAAKTARVTIEPSPRLGYSMLNLILEEKEPQLTLRANNSGQGSPSNGRYRYSLATSLSDLLLGNDTLGLNLSTRRFKEDQRNNEYSGGLTYSVPFGYSRVDLRFNHSQYERYTVGRYGGYNTSGNSQVYAAKFSHVLMREKTQKLSATAELEHKKSFNYVEKSLLKVNSVPYSKASFGLEHITQFLGGSLYSDAAFVQGLSIMGSQDSAIQRNSQRKPMRKLEFNTAWSRPFNWQNQDFTFASRIGGQYSTTNLLTAEKQGLGDEFTVRGFNGTPLWGDQAIYLSNSITMPIRALGGVITPQVGLDTGFIRDVAPNADRDRLTGMALGVNGSWKHGGGSITLGVPLSMSDEMKKVSDPTVLYLNTYLTF